ncbi:hypothetical protein [Halobacillus sp. A5]|uniref:hypothetical protein n=1 Tax=Halobacillus sp. A5 TaxID=2880263 RepID=UPI0020A63EF5|nr:hypothetical protein [Halobacillus sp. A5]MCP3027819.1 hypothetical protein [Halobacillus sp. A5]
MKNIKLNKAFNMEDSTEINFSKGLLIIDDKSENANWRVSLAKVHDTGVFSLEENNEIRLNLLDVNGQSYFGTAAPDFMSSDGSVLMKSKGELEHKE